MKKITTTLLIIVSLLFLNLNTSAQAFQKGNVNFDVGIGFGAYGTTQTQTTKLSFGAVSSDTTYTDSDGAASMVIPISFEYGVSDKIGIGADLIINNYIIAEEDKDAISSVKAFDFGAKFNYHLLNSDKNDLMIGVGIGFSSIKWELEPNIHQFIESYSGSCVYWSIGITDRIFFSENVGILFNLGYKGYSYSGLEAELTSEAKEVISSFGATFSQEIDWKFNGVNIGTGLALKF